jgi:hypothetical protein
MDPARDPAVMCSWTGVLAYPSSPAAMTLCASRETQLRAITGTGKTAYKPVIASLGQSQDRQGERSFSFS